MAGSVKKKVLPCPCVLSQQILPPCASTMEREMYIQDLIRLFTRSDQDRIGALARATDDCIGLVFNGCVYVRQSSIRLVAFQPQTLVRFFSFRPF